MWREIDVPMLLSTLLRRQVSALVSSTALSAARTERSLAVQSQAHPGGRPRLAAPILMRPPSPERQRSPPEASRLRSARRC